MGHAHLAVAAADGEEDAAGVVHERHAAPAGVVVDAEHHPPVRVVEHRVPLAVEHQRLTPHRQPGHGRHRRAQLRRRLAAGARHPHPHHHLGPLGSRRLLQLHGRTGCCNLQMPTTTTTTTCARVAVTC